MTLINRMVMEGFKSFGKFTELLFGPDFNCVLGPNGSGKSNILDALTFVLGKSSAKSMRVERASHLIYNGGKTKKPAKQAMVSIYFDNSKKIFPTEEKEVKISRIVRQNGQSIYKINDKTRTRQQVTDLLALAKINPDGYNIILQGDIVSFVEMNPLERRMLIEEIAGISLYEEKKQKALSQLQRVDERLKEAEIILAERGSYLKELRKDRDQALKFKDMADKVKQNKASLLKLHIDQKEAEKKEMEHGMEKTRQELAKVQEKISMLRKENEKRRERIEALTQEAELKGEVEQVKLSKEIEELKVGLAKKQARVETLQHELTKIKQRQQDLLGAQQDIKDKISGIEKEKEDLRKREQSLLREKDTFSKKIQHFKEKNDLDYAADMEKRIEELDKSSEDMQKEVHKLREAQHGLLREKDKIEHEMSTLDAQIQKILDLEEEHRQQLDELKKKREEFKKTTLELNKVLDEDSQLAAQLNQARARLAKLHEELAALNARNIGIREVSRSDIAAKKILEQKNKLGVIYGTVAELGRVDSKYAMALEVAAGPRIKSIVVEDDKVAANAIKYLKQNKLGIATFLPLNKIKPPAASREILELSKARGSHGMAIDLVDYDPKFKNIFEYIFSNTLIVDDIDTARRLGIGKAKMVTLEGDLAEMSGVMQGGFRERKKQGLGFSEKELSRDIAQCGQYAEEAKKSIDSLEKRRLEIEEQTARLRQQKASLEGDIIRSEKLMHIEGSTLAAEQVKKKLTESLAHYEKEIGKIHQQIEQVNRRLTDNKMEKQKLRSKVLELRDPALLAELNTFDEKLRQVNEELIRIDAERRNLDTHVHDIHEIELEKTQQIIKQHAKEEEGFNREFMDIKQQIKQADSLLGEKEEKAKTFYAQYKELFAERGRLDEEIRKNDFHINEKTEESHSIEIKLNTLSIKEGELNATLSVLQQEFSAYEGVPIDINKSEDHLKAEIAKFEKMQQNIGSVNMRALDIYEDVEREYNGLLQKKDGLGKEKEDVMSLMNEIEGKKKDLFMKTFAVVNEHFKRNFTLLSTKGEANLVLENPETIFDGGLRIIVRLSGDKFLDIRSLSGGEKTLTALAFIFAIQEHEPASFYILDEVDAALDKHNSEKLSKLISQYAQKAQYILISHNDAVISEASNLYGISMDEHGASKVISLKV